MSRGSYLFDILMANEILDPEDGPDRDELPVRGNLGQNHFSEIALKFLEEYCPLHYGMGTTYAYEDLK